MYSCTDSSGTFHCLNVSTHFMSFIVLKFPITTLQLAYDILSRDDISISLSVIIHWTKRTPQHPLSAFCLITWRTRRDKNLQWMMSLTSKNAINMPLTFASTLVIVLVVNGLMLPKVVFSSPMSSKSPGHGNASSFYFQTIPLHCNASLLRQRL